MRLSKWLQVSGKSLYTICQEVGTYGILLHSIISFFKYFYKDRHLLFDQMYRIGVRSLPLVTVVSLFTGAVSSWQAAYQFRGVISLDFLGTAVSAAIFIELSPVLTGLVVAGRVGASIAAEIGTMVITEQVEALETLAIDPVRYIAAPRFHAAWIMMPILVIYSNLLAHLGAFVVAGAMLDISAATFFSSVQKYFDLHNVFSGLIKALVFGGGTALIGSSIGFRTAGGARGVGQSTIKAFVASSTFILIGDYILAVILF